MAEQSRVTRRRALALLGAAGFAGCTTTSGESGTPTISETPEPLPRVGERYDVTFSHDIAEWDGLDPDWTAPSSAPKVATLSTETLVEDLEVPWDLSFAPDGTLFISERVGRVLSFDGEGATLVTDLDAAIDAGSVAPGEEHDSWWVDGGEGGTLGVAVHPAYPDPPLVYVYYTTKRGGSKHNRVVAYDVDAGETAGSVVDDIPADAIHNGGRLTFGPANYLWITCGDAGNAAEAQDPSTLNGSVLRVRPDGQPPADNPDLGGDADPRVYTYGHRNPQGIVWLPDGTPVVSEHGPDGRDELNRLEAGANYGWPEVRRKKHYPGSGYHKPLANSGEPSWAPTGSLFYTGDAIPSLTNRLLVGGLYSQQLLVATLTPPDETLPTFGDGIRHAGKWADDAYTVTEHTALENELGRIRHVEQGPEGDIYLVTSNRDGRAKKPFPREGDDRLVRLAVE